MHDPMFFQMNRAALAAACEGIGGEPIVSNADVAYRIPFLPSFPLILY